MFVEVVWSGVWLEIKEGSSIYSQSEGGDVSLLELLGHAANDDEKLQREGANSQRQRRSLPILADEHRRRLGKRTSARAHYGLLAATRPCLLRRLRHR